MPKPIMQDIIVKKTKVVTNSNNKDILPTRTSEPERKIPAPKPIQKSTPLYIDYRRNKTHSYTWLKIILIIISVAILTYFVFNFFEHTNINIKVKRNVLNLNKEQFIGLKSKDSPINFEIIISDDQESKTVSFNESSVVSERARGTITLYNEYTTKPQSIVINTFVEDATGKAYRTDKPVSIPGYKLVNGKVVPGQVSVGITAFLDGESYNGTPSHFTITAFKNTSKAKKIYAKATTPISGGAKGLIYKLKSNDRDQLVTYANTVLKEKMLTKLSALIPAGYILYPNASTFSFDIDENIISKESSGNVVIRTTTSALILEEKDLMKAIIKNTMPQIVMPELKEISISGVQDLVFNFVNKNQTITKDMQSVAFTLTGDIDVVWNPDLASLQKNVAGIQKDSIKQILENDPGIASSTVKVFPSWKSNLPTNQEKIHIQAE